MSTTLKSQRLVGADQKTCVIMPQKLHQLYGKAEEYVIKMT